MNGSIHPLHIHNFWALLVSAVIIWVLGAIWYSPVLFAKPWMKMVPSCAKKQLAMFAGMGSSFVCDLVLSLILWHVVSWAGARTWETGALVGFLVWLGFIVAPQLPQGIYESRPFKLFAINTGYWLVSLLISGALLAVWV